MWSPSQVGVQLGSPSPNEACQTSEPSSTFRQLSRLPPLLPSVYSLPFWMATLEYPRPKPRVRQASGGPSLGHSVNSPFSCEMLSPFGPRQRDHSPFWASNSAGSEAEPFGRAELLVVPLFGLVVLPVWATADRLIANSTAPARAPARGSQARRESRRRIRFS